MKYFMLVITLIFLSVSRIPNTAAQTPTQNAFLNELAKDTWTYLSTRSTHHLPWSWWSPVNEVGSYANPTEIGFHMLAYLAAYEMRQSWSPTFSTVVSEVTATLDQLRTWQTDPANSKDGIFYHWYDVNKTPPSVGKKPADKALSSIDNTFLAASLIVIREWGAANNAPSLSQKANTILQGINLRLWYDSSTSLFWHGTVNSYQSDAKWDNYSNENRIINFIARARGQLSPTEFQASLNELLIRTPSRTYESITVEKVAYDGSYFTYTAPALFISEMNTPYGATTIVPATLAQIAYAENSGYAAWGLSDCFDETGEYVGQGAPPAIKTKDLEKRAGLVTPHASALALITPLASDAAANLQTLANISGAYDDNYGFRDSVMVKTGVQNVVSNYFSALAQEYILLSIANAQTEFIWRYFYNDAGVRAAHQEMFSPILPSPVQSYPPNGSTLQPSILLWQPVSGAMRYQIQYGQNNPPDMLPASLAVNSFGMSPLAPGTYYWRVRAVNSSDEVSAWSAVWSFTVVSSAGAPPSRNYFTTSMATLTWYGVPWATGYEVQVDNELAFSSPEYTNAGLPGSETSVTTTFLPDGLYYWRVRAKKPDNSWGVWSSVDSFTISSASG